MKKIQVQGVHHITIVGSTKQSAIDFWQGLLGMPFVLEQPNLGKPDENHLYFDPGDGRLLTVFTNESSERCRRPHRASRLRRAPRVQCLAGDVHRRLPPACANAASSSSSATAASWTRSISTIPNGLKVELACYKFETPEAFARSMC